jgi:hypothetical protein
MKTLTIFVELVGEGTQCWRPVEAEQLSDSSFRIIGAKPEDEIWRFNSGDVVRCKLHQFHDGSGLVAYMEER